MKNHPSKWNIRGHARILKKKDWFIAPLSFTADDCFPRARLQPPRKKVTSCGVFRHVLFPQESVIFHSRQLK